MMVLFNAYENWKYEQSHSSTTHVNSAIEDENEMNWQDDDSDSVIDPTETDKKNKKKCFCISQEQVGKWKFAIESP
jgi:hypothetical protein